MPKRTQSYGLNNPLQDVFPVPVVGQRAPTANDVNYEIGQMWVDQTTSQMYGLVSVASGSANWSSLSKQPVSMYIVGTEGNAPYQTIQSAINAANDHGGGTVYVQPGFYQENLTLYSNVDMLGSGIACSVQGQHTPPITGSLSFNNFNLSGDPHIFFSEESGDTNIDIQNCITGSINGYIYYLPNWGGITYFSSFLKILNCITLGLQEGIIFNNGEATLLIMNSTAGFGFSNPLVMGGTGLAIFSSSTIAAPLNFSDSVQLVINNGCTISDTLTLEDNVSLACSNSSLPTIVFNSTEDSFISSCTIDSSDNPAIDGTGSGTLSLTGINFVDNDTISTSLTIAGGNSLSGSFKTTDAAEGLTITGNTIETSGSNPNINMILNPKGIGNVVLERGNLSIQEASKHLELKGGTANDFIGQATLVAGTVTIAKTNILSSDRVIVTREGIGSSTSLGILNVSITPSTSFTIQALQPGTPASVETNDVSIVNYFIVRQI